MKFSVLIAVYYKEQGSHLRDALMSILDQTLVPDEIVLVKDGPLTGELDAVIEDFQNKNPGKFKIVQLPENQGLGKALRTGLTECTHEIVARMDSDDISEKNRFEKQVRLFEINPDVDLVGSWTCEFYGDRNNIIAVRKVPETHEEIVKFAKRRSPVNHVTVVFRKCSVLKAGNYMDFLWYEDYYLWVRMLLNGAKMYNVQEPLVRVRVSEERYRRRGGWKYAIQDIKFQSKLHELGFINTFRMISNIVIRTSFRLVPNGVRAKIYQNLLRKKNYH